MDEFIHEVTTRLTGKAYRDIHYKKPKTYEELKAALNATADKKQTLNHLHSKLSMLRITSGETIQQYSERAEQLYYVILESSIATNEISNTGELSKITASQVLTAGGQDRSIAYASRTLNKAKQSYSTTEKELLSNVWAIKHFRPYLLGRRFKIFTDHRPLTWLFSVKDQGSRLMRWRLKLSEYDYEVIYLFSH